MLLEKPCAEFKRKDLKQKAELSFAVWLLYFYKGTISYFFGPCCRFYPSCSEYSKQAYQKHGYIKGTKLTFFRLLRCRPFGPSGYDPVE